MNTTPDQYPGHVTVLQKETIDALNLKEDSVVVDATFGRGGHSKEILSRLGSKGMLVSLDADPKAIQEGITLMSDESRVHLHKENFRNIATVLGTLGIASVDGICADLGWRIEQMSGNKGEDDGRGFSFLKDEPLLMTYGEPEKYAFTARDILNEWSEEAVADVLFGYGEERYSRRIARKVVEAREDAPIETTSQFVALIEKAVPSGYRHGKLHPATKSFQALRIAVNEELDALKEFINASMQVLGEGGRLAIITFHSIEDRLVKHTFRQYAHESVGTVITKKPITPSTEEVGENPRARSAKLRVIEKTNI